MLLQNGAITVPATLGYTPGGTTITLTPASPLSEKTLYTVTLKGGVGADRILDVAGNALAADYVWSFTTVDQTAPTVLSTSPVNNANNVAISTTITAEVSEALNASSVTNTSVLLQNGAITVPATLGYTPGSTTITLTPASPLAEKTLYTVTLKGGVGADRILDVAGNALAADYVWSFTTGDFTAPTVVSTSPASNATSININTVITAEVSEALDATSITNTSVLLQNGAITVPATLGYTPGSTTITLTPASPLSEKTLYTVTLKGGVGADRILDVAGNAMAADYVWSFTTVDQTAPTVVSTSPANNATSINVNTVITAELSEALNAASITNTSVLLQNGAISVPATLGYTPGSTTITLTPASPLSEKTLYTVTLKGGAGVDRIVDVAGNALAADYVWSFTTGDFTAPTVVSTSPASNATAVAVNTVITAEVSEALDAASVTNTSVLLQNGAITVPATLGYTPGSTTITLTPASPLSEKTLYTVTLKGGVGADRILDVAGNALAADYVWSFTTVDQTAPTVVSTSPANNATSINVNTVITAEVSEALNAASVTNTSVLLQNGAISVPATLGYTPGSTTITLTPASPLSEKTLYTVTLKGGVGADRILDVAGNALAADYVWSFTTGDFTAPTVVSTSPASNATSININTVITAEVSEALNASSVTNTSVLLQNGAITVPATLGYTPGGTTITLTPASPLSEKTLYTVTLKGGVGADRILDVAGNALAADYVWSFTTVDQTAPTVLSTSPVNNANNVAISTTITAEVSEALNASSVTNTSVLLQNGAITVPATLGYTPGSTTITLTPASPLAEKTLYTVTLKGGVGADRILDVAGNALAADYVWSFTTGDFTAPTVVSTSPASNATSININTVITAEVSEALDATSITNTSVLLQNGAITVPATLGYTPGGTTITLTPASPLAEKTLYTVTLKGGAGADRLLDVAGNALAADYTWNFTTIDQIAPTVVSVTPANNTTGIAINAVVTALLTASGCIVCDQLIGLPEAGAYIGTYTLPLYCRRYTWLS